MTTVATNEEIQVTETVETVEVVSVKDQWKGDFVTHEMGERARTMAAELKPLAKVSDKGVAIPKSAYYAVAASHGVSKETIQTVHQLDADYAEAVHGLSSDFAINFFKGNTDAEATFTVNAKMGENSTYKDTYKRQYSRTVRNPQTGEATVKEYTGYHRPSIETEYKNLNSHRTAVMALALDLLK